MGRRFDPPCCRGRLVAAVAIGLAACAASPPTAPGAPLDASPAQPARTQVPAEAVRALAPTGTLRVAVYPGSPTSLVQAPGSAERRGLTVELGSELARRLGVPAAIVVYPRVAEILAAMARGEADFTITNATADRAREVDFTDPLLALELGVLVRAGAPAIDPAALDRAGLRIGVSQGSSSQRVLAARLTRAALVPLPTLEAAAQALEAGAVDGFATNKAILYELADRVPGSAVMPGRWGLEHLAIATGKGRGAGFEFLRGYAKDVAREGRVAAAAARAGLRGSAAVE